MPSFFAFFSQRENQFVETVVKSNEYARAMCCCAHLFYRDLTVLRYLCWNLQIYFRFLENVLEIIVTTENVIERVALSFRFFSVERGFIMFRQQGSNDIDARFKVRQVLHGELFEEDQDIETVMFCQIYDLNIQLSLLFQLY